MIGTRTTLGCAFAVWRTMNVDADNSNRFSDRDQLMRQLGIGVGHVGQVPLVLRERQPPTRIEPEADPVRIAVPQDGAAEATETGRTRAEQTKDDSRNNDASDDSDVDDDWEEDETGPSSTESESGDDSDRDEEFLDDGELNESDGSYE